MNGIEYLAEDHPPLPPPIKGEVTKPFLLVGQAFQPAGGLERPPHREGKVREIPASFRGTDLHATSIVTQEETLVVYGTVRSPV